MNKRDENIIVCLAAFVGAYAAILNSTKSPKKKRQASVKNWLLERQKKGAYHGIVSDLRLTNREDFRNFLRMNTESFQVK